MIKTREDLKKYLKEDSRNYWHLNYGFFDKLKTRLFVTPISDQKYTWKYIYNLRHLEYHLNNVGYIHKLLSAYYSWRLRNLGYKTGIQIPPNVCDKGLTIWHYGTIIINPKCKIGKSCKLNPRIAIGHKNESGGAPVIGNNVTIHGGSTLIGDIRIGDNSIIGAGSVVTRSIPADCIAAGNPCKVIRRLERE